MCKSPSRRFMRLRISNFALGTDSPSWGHAGICAGLRPLSSIPQSPDKPERALETTLSNPTHPNFVHLPPHTSSPVGRLYATHSTSEGWLQPLGKYWGLSATADFFCGFLGALLFKCLKPQQGQILAGTDELNSLTHRLPEMLNNLFFTISWKTIGCTRSCEMDFREQTRRDK